MWNGVYSVMRERIEELIRLNKYTDLKELLVTMNVADIAELIEGASGT